MIDGKQIKEESIHGGKMQDGTIDVSKLNFTPSGTNLFQAVIPIDFYPNDDEAFIEIGGTKLNFFSCGVECRAANGDFYVIENGLITKVGYNDGDKYFFGTASEGAPPPSEPEGWDFYFSPEDRNNNFLTPSIHVYLYRNESLTSPMSNTSEFFLIGLLDGGYDFIITPYEPPLGPPL